MVDSKKILEAAELSYLLDGPPNSVAQLEDALNTLRAAVTRYNDDADKLGKAHHDAAKFNFSFRLRADLSNSPLQILFQSSEEEGS